MEGEKNEGTLVKSRKKIEDRSPPAENALPFAVNIETFGPVLLVLHS